MLRIWMGKQSLRTLRIGSFFLKGANKRRWNFAPILLTELPHQNTFILYFDRNFKKLLLNNYTSVYNKTETISMTN
jgi:hypothetical protein